MEQYILSLAILFTSVVLFVAGIWFSKKPPKNINGLYGYRTFRSMKNQESWDYAQKLAPQEIIKSSLYLLLLAVISMFVDDQNSWIRYTLICLLMGIVLIPVFTVEAKLKKQFP